MFKSPPPPNKSERTRLDCSQFVSLIIISHLIVLFYFLDNIISCLFRVIFLLFVVVFHLSVVVLWLSDIVLYSFSCDFASHYGCFTSFLCLCGSFVSLCDHSISLWSCFMYLWFVFHSFQEGKPAWQHRHWLMEDVNGANNRSRSVFVFFFFFFFSVNIFFFNYLFACGASGNISTLAQFQRLIKRSYSAL